jgi:epoxyqueuosine reductase
MPRLTPDLLERLGEAAETYGLLRLGAVSLDHPGFASAGRALDGFLDADRAGEMEFLERTRDVRKDPRSMLPGAQSILVAVVPHAGEAGPIARYAQFADYHTVVHRRLLRLAGDLERALPGVESLVCVDTKPIMERAAAHLAGLGFLGKHGNLIVPGLGSYVLIGSLLCTAQWAPAASPEFDETPWDACGACRACLDACPTQAFVGAGDLDARRCISYLTIEHRGPVPEDLQDELGVRVAGCDVCQEVCPYNQSEARAERVPQPAWLPRRPAGQPRGDLAHLASVGNNQHRSFVKDTALTRIPRRALRRNALFALGNLSEKLDEASRRAMEDAATDADPQVRGAAQRAIARQR